MAAKVWRCSVYAKFVIGYAYAKFLLPNKLIETNRMNNIMTLYLTLCAIVSFAQNQAIDSLQQALKNYDAKKLELQNDLLPDESDTLKVDILNKISWECIMVSDYLNAKKYADDALAISQLIGFKKGIANAYNTIGIIYNKLGNFPEGIKNYFAALKIREEIGDKKGVSASYNNIGNIYFEQGNYPEALKHYSASLKTKEETGDKKGIAISFNNIGNILKKQGNYSEALKNYFASSKIKEDVGDKKGIATSYNNIGVTYLDQGNYEEAIKYHLAALKLFDEIGDKEAIATSFINIGSIKIKIQEAREGKAWLLKGLKLGKEIAALPILRDSYEGLALADSALGNFKDAYENHKKYILYRDSLNNEEAIKKLLQTKMQFEFDKKEAETKAHTDSELKRQKLLRNVFLVGFIIVLLFAGVFFRQRNKTKKEKQRAEEEKKRSEDLLLNILPSEVAVEIKTSGTAKAKAFTMVTVMFTDFKDFTKVSEKISAELLVDEIHACFSAFDTILSKYNIEKIKTIGDAYLCASGLPVSNYTHALDMLNAAFEIRNYMLQRKKEKEAKGEISFELRIGIHTGPVVAGVVGVKKYAYDIWGDTVNIAARMEQSSEVGKINISGSTYELVKDKFKCEHRGKIQAKNKGEINMYFVEGMI
ncbi:MAG TPA: adenylate/guanylate cyclase domain-containing protein [Saprospiraceae bacterium]|nr:adenylate/guanylate cyclase domain-containing protein [Saprospiraceae bacterium]